MTPWSTTPFWISYYGFAVSTEYYEYCLRPSNRTADQKAARPHLERTSEAWNAFFAWNHANAAPMLKGMWFLVTRPGHRRRIRRSTEWRRRVRTSLNGLDEQNNGSRGTSDPSHGPFVPLPHHNGHDHLIEIWARGPSDHALLLQHAAAKHIGALGFGCRSHPTH